MRRLRQSSLTTLLVLFAVTIVAATAAGVGIWLVQASGADMVQDLNERAGAVGRGLAALAIEPLERGDRKALETLLDTAWNTDDLGRIEVRSMSGHVVAAREFPTPVDPTARPVISMISGPEDESGFSSPVGQVAVFFSRAGLARRQARAAGRAFAISAAVGAGAAAVGVGLALVLAAPLQRLRRAAGQLAAGDYVDAEQVPVAGPREVQALGRRLREAAHAVADREARLIEVNAELHRTQELRDAMTHMLVHDLKGPLSNLMMLLDLLQSAPLDAEDAELLHEGQLRVGGLIEKVTDLLLIARLEAGHISLDLHRRAVDDLVDAALASIQVLASQRGYKMRIEAPDEEAADLVCDPRLIERVLLNLLTNALTYGQSPVDVRATVDDTVARFVVEDAGPGIPSEAVEQVFARFGTLDKGRGTGLGLAFVRMAVEAHGGAITVQGARFEVTLPRRPGGTA